MPESLLGKIALVTGSAQGLGRVIALELAKCGCHLLVNCAHRPENAARVCAEIVQAGGSAEILICDVADEKAVQEKILPRTVDILVNNARLDPYQRPPDATDAEWFRALLNVNLIGAYLVTLAVASGMKKRSWGRILNVSSVQAHLGMPPQLLPYSVSKVGMHGLTRGFAVELGEFGITVNTLAPGMVMTENIARRLTPEEIAARLKRYPLHRAATAEEVAQCAVNAIRSPSMTGETININSGLYFAP